MIKFSIVNNPAFYMLLGPEAGYLLSASSEIINDDNSKTKDSISDIMNKMNFTLIIGAGVEFKIFKQIFFVESFYGYGLLETAKDSDWIYTWQTRELNLSVGYKF